MPDKRVYSEAVSHVTQGKHLADRTEIEKIDAFGWVLSIFTA
jgi:hypothetical protein